MNSCSPLPTMPTLLSPEVASPPPGGTSSAVDNGDEPSGTTEHERLVMTLTGMKEEADGQPVRGGTAIGGFVLFDGAVNWPPMETDRVARR